MESRPQSQSIVIFFGPPGAGKGTQAEYLVDRFGFLHLETSKIIQEALFSHDDSDTIVVNGVKYSYGEERRKFFDGKLNTPEVVILWVSKVVRDLFGQGKNLVLSGSPRTALEAEALFRVFTELAIRDTCHLFYLDVQYDVCFARNTQRLLCMKCRLPHRGDIISKIIPDENHEGQQSACRRCGGELQRRKALDDPEIMRVRWEEYEKRTLPVLDIARSYGLLIERIDASLSEEDIHKIVLGSLFSRGSPASSD